MANEAKQVRQFVNTRIGQILRTPADGPMKATLANMRRGIGKIPGDLPELWGMLFLDFPETLFSKRNEPSKAEWAAYTALTLFALHQQGHEPKKEPMHQPNVSFGQAVGQLIEKEEDEARIRRRFQVAATSSDMTELSQHMRGMVQLLRTKGIPMDYAAVAEDLYWYQFMEYAPSVRLKWGQDFYRRNWKNAEAGKEDTNE